MLPALFGQVHVVEPVVQECAAGGVISVPSLDSLSWVVVEPVSADDPEPMITQLDEGEKWTIHAAHKRGAELLADPEKLSALVMAG